MFVAFFKGGTHEILWEYFLLENFGDSELSSAFHLESFELLDFVVEVEDHVSFLEHLRVVLLDVQLSCFLFLFSCRDHHGFVWSVDLEENSHLFSSTVTPLFFRLQPLILIIGIFVVDKVVEYVAGI